VRVAQPDRVILFGSAARGAMHEASDLDLLIVRTGSFRPHEVVIAIDAALDAADIDIAVDLVEVTPEDLARYGRSPALVHRDALEEGKVVNEAADSLA
jgi:uncharacterized protein